LLTYFKLLATMACWGGTFVAGRMLAGEVPPFHAALLRFLLAGLLLLWLLLRSEGRLPRLSRRQLGAVTLLGLTGVLGYNAAFFTGLQSVSAGRAGLIIALNPVGITLLSALIGGEPLSRIRSFGVLLSVAGAMLVISRGNISLLPGGIGAGELMLLGCVISWSLYSVIGKRAMREISSLAAVTYSAVIGALLLLPLAALQADLSRVVDYSFVAWGSIVYLALFGTVVGFLWYYQSIREIGTVRAAVFINFVPVFAMLFGLLLLDEPLTPTVLQGGVLILTGAWITNNDGWRLRKR